MDLQFLFFTLPRPSALSRAPVTAAAFGYQDRNKLRTSYEVRRMRRGAEESGFTMGATLASRATMVSEPCLSVEIGYGESLRRPIH
jgi:hypothetical protein